MTEISTFERHIENNLMSYSIQIDWSTLVAYIKYIPIIIGWLGLCCTCHTSCCEIKSHRIWPIWKAIPIKIQISQNFQTILQQILWRNKHKTHTVVVFTTFLHEKKKKKKKFFRLYWRSSKVMFKKISQNFVKSPLKFCLISQILVHSWWNVC